MGSTRSHPLPPGIFMEMPPTNEELIEEIKRLRQRVKELESKKVVRVDYKEVVLDPPDDDDIMHDPDVREMVENGEHTCHMFDAHCQACEDDDEDDEVRVLTEEEVLNDPEMTQSAAIQRVDKLRAHFC
jgi:exo-beta-1,3-glucanase (GH17 family)